MKKIRNDLLFRLDGKDAFTGLQKILDSDVNLKIKDLNALKKTFESVGKQRQYLEKSYEEIIRKYGVEDEQGNIQIKDEEKAKLAEKDFYELMMIEEELDIRELDVSKFEEIEMNVVEYLMLLELFKETVEAEVVQ